MTTKNESLARTSDAPQPTLKTMLEAAKGKLAAVAPKYLSVERVLRLTLAACSRNHKLMQCTPESVLLFAMRCAETGLEPIGAGGAWPVPFKNKHTDRMEMVFMPDYRGLIGQAVRAKAITSCRAHAVYEKDDFSLTLGLEPDLKHTPSLTGARGEAIGYYAVFALPDGQKQVQFMRKDEVDAIRKRSRSASDGPWVTDYEAMALKTVIRRGLKFFAMTPEMKTALEYDNEVSGVEVDVTPVKQPEPLPERVGANPSHDDPKQAIPTPEASGSPQGEAGAKKAATPEKPSEPAKAETFSCLDVHFKASSPRGKGKGMWHDFTSVDGDLYTTQTKEHVEKMMQAHEGSEVGLEIEYIEQDGRRVVQSVK